MDLDHTKTAEYRKNSLRKMSISFSMVDEQDILETRRDVDVDTNKHGMNAGLHQHHNPIIATRNSHFEDRSVRVERRVACQSLMLGSNYDSGCTADGKECLFYGQKQWSWGQPSGQSDTSPPPRRTTLPDPRGVDDYRVMLHDSELVRLGDPTSVTPKWSRSPRLVYTDEEKLFIMHARVIGSVSWEDISKIFKNIFGRKGTKYTIPSLMEIYDRTFRDWGMGHGRRRRPGQYQTDEMVLEEKLSKHAGRSHIPRVMSQVWDRDAAR
jgi:hypothetical protein